MINKVEICGVNTSKLPMLSPDDLFQIGCVGLIKAIDNFDPSLNVQFSAYRSSDDIPLVEIIHIKQ